MFHCTAGKDRAGFAAAMTLRALGASHETVLRDYLATNTCTAGLLDQLMAALAAERIESRPTWKPMHLQPLFAGARMFAHDPARAPVCERLFAHGLCLPSGTAMSDSDLDRVTGVAKRLLAPLPGGA